MKLSSTLKQNGNSNPIGKVRKPINHHFAIFKWYCRSDSSTSSLGPSGYVNAKKPGPLRGDIVTNILASPAPKGHNLGDLLAACIGACHEAINETN